MRKILLLTVFLSQLANTNGQTNSVNTIRSSFSVSIDENTVVKDLKGNRVPYATVLKLIATGQFTIDLVKDTHGNATECKLREVKKEDAGKRETYMRIPGTENNPKPQAGENFHYRDLATMNKSEMLSANDYKDKIIVLNFWYGNCKTCNQYKNNSDVIFIAANPDTRDTVQKFLADHPLTYTVSPQSTSLIDDLKIQIYPTHLVIGRDGKILNSYSGGLPGIDEILKKDIESALRYNLKLASKTN